MAETEIAYPPVYERGVERLRRAARKLRVRSELATRRKLAASLPRKPELDRLIDERTAYGRLPENAIGGMAEAIAFAHKVRDESRGRPANPKKVDYRTTILNPKRYEDGPAFFELALSDEALGIASDYLGEIPVLLQIKLWNTPVNRLLKGSQLYHRDGGQWTLRRVKFIINMDRVDEDRGPFTFIPADVSARVSKVIGSVKPYVEDEMIFRHADSADAISVVGPAGSGAVLDSSRCFHYGARSRGGKRLVLMFQYLRLSDAMHGGTLGRSKGFSERFGDDPIRNRVIPRHE